MAASARRILAVRGQLFTYGRRSPRVWLEVRHVGRRRRRRLTQQISQDEIASGNGRRRGTVCRDLMDAGLGQQSSTGAVCPERHLTHRLAPDIGNPIVFRLATVHKGKVGVD